MARRSAAVVIVALLGLLASGELRSAAANDGMSACGSLGAPPCPLQVWMRKNVAAPLSSNDVKALAKALARTAEFVPDGEWKSWSRFAKEGAAAAARGDVTGARAACKGCHSAWRSEYRAKYRARPIAP